METSRDDFGLAVRSAFLKKETKQKFSLLALVILSVVLIFIDSLQVKPLNFLRSFVKDTIYRGSVLASIPSKGFRSFTGLVENHLNLFNENIKLKEENINSKVVSMPCQELFDKQPKEYREKIIEKNSKKISIEASSIFGWEKYVGPEGSSLGMKSFGKSAPYKAIYENFNLTSDSVVMIAKKILGK